MRSISKIIGKTFQLTSLFVILSMVIFVAACGSDDEDTLSHNNSTLKGVIRIDGSSTVYPLSEAVAEDYGNKEKDVKLNVSVSGTGGGFKRFCPGETDISNASRPIKDKEINMCNENNVDYIELIIALDGLSIMVSPQNEFVDCLTMQELNNIWKPESLITNWKDIRDGFPDKKLDLYGPDTDSGTFDYFTDEVNGDEGVSRSDYTASADDNVLVTGISGSAGSLGYFGYAYYVENIDKLKAEEAFKRKICLPMNISIEEAAISVFRIMIAKTVSAIREISVERGLNPKDFRLVGFGGCGPMFSALIANELDKEVEAWAKLPVWARVKAGLNMAEY